MTKQDRKKLGVLIVLVAVLGVTLLMSYRMNTAESSDAIHTPENAASPNALPTPSDAIIRLDILDTPDDEAQTAGNRNLFRYREAPPPPPPAVKAGPSIAIPAQPVTPSATAQTPVKPAPPPIPLQYQGFADTSPDGGYVAFLAEGAKHYNVKTGEVLLGRYRIMRISATSVEVEDLEYNRKQSLPLLK